MRVLTQFENGVVSGGCGVCGGKQVLDPTPIVVGVLMGLVTGMSMDIAGVGAGFIVAGTVVGVVVGVTATQHLHSS